MEVPGIGAGVNRFGCSMVCLRPLAFVPSQTSIVHIFLGWCTLTMWAYPLMYIYYTCPFTPGVRPWGWGTVRKAVACTREPRRPPSVS